MFHLAVNRVQTGPLSEADVRERLASGAVRGEDLCWREGWEKWRKVSEVFPPLEPPVLPNVPPPLPQTTATVPSAMNPAAGAAPSSGLATASLVCGIAMFVLFPLFIPLAIAAIVTGHVAQAKIKHSGGTVGGGGRALAGVIMGYLGIAALPIIGLLAAMAIPAYQKVRDNSQQATVRNHLVQIWSAAEQQMLETGAETVSYDQLVGPGKSLEEDSLKPVAGEDYHSLVIHRGDESISVTLRNGRTVEYSAETPAGGAVVEEAIPDKDTDAEKPQEEQPGADAPTAPAAEPEA